VSTGNTVLRAYVVVTVLAKLSLNIVGKTPRPATEGIIAPEFLWLVLIDVSFTRGAPSFILLVSSRLGSVLNGKVNYCTLHIHRHDPMN
jgi:hypothetical protein